MLQFGAAQKTLHNPNEYFLLKSKYSHNHTMPCSCKKKYALPIEFERVFNVRTYKENKMSTVQQRFDGDEGRQRVLAALFEQLLVESDSKRAEWLLNNGELVVLQAGDVLIRKDDSDTDAYLILFGSLMVWIEGNPHKLREAGNFVGETPALQPGAKRVALVTANEECALWMCRDGIRLTV